MRLNSRTSLPFSNLGVCGRVFYGTPKIIDSYGCLLAVQSKCGRSTFLMLAADWRDSRTRSSVSGTRPTPASTTARSSSNSLMRPTSPRRSGPTAPTRSAEIEPSIAGKGLESRIHRRAVCSRPLSQAQAANTTRSKVRARVEHVFGHQKNAISHKIVAPSAWRGRGSRSA